VQPEVHAESAASSSHQRATPNTAVEHAGGDGLLSEALTKGPGVGTPDIRPLLQRVHGTTRTRLILRLQRAYGNRQVLSAIQHELAGSTRAVQRLPLAAPAVPKSHPVLRQTPKTVPPSTDVTELQEKLNTLGPFGDPLDITGVFDSKTHSAVQRFQRKSGLEPDGVVGPLTWGALDRLSGDEASPSAGPD
jgi:murein L,D-transpeptidase YcbB/YkuD